MNHRALLLLVPLTVLPACKKDPRDVMHTEEIGDTGWVIDLPKDSRTKRFDKETEGRWNIRSGDYPEGYIYLDKLTERDRIPDEEWAVSACGGSNAVYKDTAGGGKSVTCFKNENGSSKYVGKSWTADGKGSYLGCEYVALGQGAKDATALALSKRVCPSIRKK